MVENNRLQNTTGGAEFNQDTMVDRVWKIVIVGILFLLLFQEETIKIVGRWKDPQEMHGFLIPLFSLYFVYLERERLKTTLGKPSYIGLVLMLLSVLGYLFFFFKPMKWCFIRTCPRSNLVNSLPRIIKIV